MLAIVLIGLWAVVWLFSSAFLIPFGGDAACQARPDPTVCLDRFTKQWAGLMVVEVASALGAIVLLARRRKPLALALAGIGTGGVAVAFIALWGLDL